MSGHYQNALYLGDVSERVRILRSCGQSECRSPRLWGLGMCPVPMGVCRGQRGGGCAVRVFGGEGGDSRAERSHSPGARLAGCC